MSRLTVVLTLVSVAALVMCGCRESTPAPSESMPSNTEGPAAKTMQMLQEEAAKAQEAATEVMEEVSATVEEAAAKVEDVRTEVEQKAGEVIEDVTGKIEGSETKTQELPGVSVQDVTGTLKKEVPTIP